MKFFITESDIHRMVAKCVSMLLKEDIGSFGGDGGPEGKDNVIKEYDAIGFASKFYTLWRVFERKYSITYVFRKNISFSREKAQSLYPDAVFKEDLRGKSHSFTVSKLGSNGDAGGMTPGRIPMVNIEQGMPMEFERFFVRNVSIRTTKYGKPYTCIEGEDLDGDIYFDIIVNVFEGQGAVIPKRGDIMKVKGVVGFFNETGGQVYLNDCKYEVTSTTRDSSEPIPEGTKIDLDAVISGFQRAKVDRRGFLEKPGIILLSDENGNDFYVEAIVSEFRTGKVVTKFDMSSMRIGDKYHISGTIKNVNGYNRVIRAKMDLVEKCPDLADAENKVKFIKLTETYTQGKTKNQKTYQLKEDDLDALFEHILKLKNENDAKMYATGCYNVGEYTVDVLKAKFNETVDNAIKGNCLNGYFEISLVIYETREEVKYALAIYFNR